MYDKPDRTHGMMKILDGKSRQHNSASDVERVVNLLVGRRFDHDGKEYVITWNDDVHLRATPLDCKTGLTSEEFRVDEIGIVNMKEG